MTLVLSVSVLTDDGEVHELTDGSLIGRSPRCELQLFDARVSELHATISHRGVHARLLGLRGRFAVDGEMKDDAVLEPGMTVHLARDLSLRVLSVETPETVLAVDLPDGREFIPAGVTSLFEQPPYAKRGWTSRALAWVWSAEGEWFTGRDHGQPLHPGDAIQVGDARFPTRSVSGRPVADTEHGDFASPLTLRCFFDVVHLERAGRPVLVLGNNAARIIGELVTSGCPLPWIDLARTISGDADPAVLRRRWDNQLHRLRATLRKAGISPGLVSPDGSGLVHLVMRTTDVILDES